MLWTSELLDRAVSGDDLWLSTQLMNESTFSAEEITAFYKLRDQGFVKTYHAVWDANDINGVLQFHAPNDAMALKWLEDKYTKMPDELVEVITTTRQVSLPMTQECV